MSLGKTVLTAAALVLAASVGYAAWSAHEKRAEQAAIAQAVEQGAQALAASLGGEPSAQQAEAARAAAKSLAAMRTSRQREMARAADEYLAAAAAVAERRVANVRLAKQASDARAAVVAHFAAPERRSPNWIHRATELKRTATQQQADLERSLNAVADNLDSLRDPEKVLARYLDTAKLVPLETRLAASARARAEAKTSAEALEGLRRLAER